MANQEFKGFVLPKSNYFRLPNEWTDITHDMTSMSEMKVVEYILRHTWGYNGQESKSKRISTDEFINGRKRKNGSRIDRGTGLSAESVRMGLKRAIEHGFINVDKDKRDLGRIKRSYCLAMEDDPSLHPGDLDPQSRPLESRDQQSGSRDQQSGSRDRTWKDNSRKTTEGNTTSNSMFDPSGSNSDRGLDEDPSTQKPKASKKKKEPTTFDYRATDEFKKVVSSHIKVDKRFERKKWAHQFRLMRERDGRTKKEIQEIIKWYGNHIGDEFVPEAFSSAAFREKFDKFVSAVRREKNKNKINGNKITAYNKYDTDNCINGVPKVIEEKDIQYDGILVDKIRRECGNRYGQGLPTIEQVDEVLVVLGERAGIVPVSVIGRVWGK